MKASAEADAGFGRIVCKAVDGRCCTPGGAGMLQHDERADGHYVRAEATCRSAAYAALRFLIRRERSDEIGSEEPVSWDGELTAYAERVSSRGRGRQVVFFLMGSMDWRR
jgi:hypothetical protein